MIIELMTKLGMIIPTIPQLPYDNLVKEKGYAALMGERDFSPLSDDHRDGTIRSSE